MQTRTIARELPLEGLSPSKLWGHLDPAVRQIAAQALYDHDWGRAQTRREADLAVAGTLRARELTVRKMPAEKRADYLARAVRPTDSLASSLLLALHLRHRRDLLSTFLDALGIPHEDGLISEQHEVGALDPDTLARAAATLFAKFPEEAVETYLATLVAMDPELWSPLVPILRDRS